MKNMSLSNYSVNCVNRVENRCSVHGLEVTASNTCTHLKTCNCIATISINSNLTN